jgi:hypothetical protein
MRKNSDVVDLEEAEVKIKNQRGTEGTKVPKDLPVSL